MKITSASHVSGTEREVRCPNGGFVSRRMLLESDGLGYTITHTTIPPGPVQHWHYENHYESCYCIAGMGWITDLATGEKHRIVPGVMYVLDNHDDHLFQAETEVVLICVFNPPLKGREVHDANGVYHG